LRKLRLRKLRPRRPLLLRLRRRPPRPPRLKRLPLKRKRRLSNDRLVVLGTISGAFGVRGEVRIRSFTEPPENIGDYEELIADPGGRTLKLLALRPSTKGLAARIEGVNDRDAAEALRGLNLCVPRDELPQAEEDEFYHVDLVGCRAVSQGGQALGDVIAVQDFGAGPLLEVGEKGKTSLYPFTRQAVPEVDLKMKRVVIADDAVIAEEEDER
jgi:16S rRNA processing protein RimM